MVDPAHSEIRMEHVILVNKMFYTFLHYVAILPFFAALSKEFPKNPNTDNTLCCTIEISKIT